MIKNIGVEDSFIRLLVGVAFLVIFLVEQFTSAWSVFLIFMGFLNIVNSIVRYSLIYKYFNINTNKKKTA